MGFIVIILKWSNPLTNDYYHYNIVMVYRRLTDTSIVIKQWTIIIPTSIFNNILKIIFNNILTPIMAVENKKIATQE